MIQELQKYIGYDVTEVMEKIKKENKAKVGFTACAEGEVYKGCKFENILVKFDSKTQKVTRIIPAYKN